MLDDLLVANYCNFYSPYGTEGIRIKWFDPKHKGMSGIYLRRLSGSFMLETGLLPTYTLVY